MGRRITWRCLGPWPPATSSLAMPEMGRASLRNYLGNLPDGPRERCNLAWNLFWHSWNRQRLGNGCTRGTSYRYGPVDHLMAGAFVKRPRSLLVSLLHRNAADTPWGGREGAKPLAEAGPVHSEYDCITGHRQGSFEDLSARRSYSAFRVALTRATEKSR